VDGDECIISIVSLEHVDDTGEAFAFSWYSWMLLMAKSSGDIETNVS
jgi:hypothetical protein